MESGEEITLLPYDDDLGGGGGVAEGNKTIEADAKGGDDNTGPSKPKPEPMEEGGVEGVGELPADEQRKGDHEFGDNHEGKPEEHDLSPPPSADQKPEPGIAEPEEELPESDGSRAPPATPQPEDEQSEFPEPVPAQPHSPEPAPVSQPEEPKPAAVHPPQPEPAHTQPYQPPPEPTPVQPHHPIPAAPEPQQQPGACHVIASGMNQEMQQNAISTASDALAQFPNHMMAVAQHIVMNFEQHYGPPWHCVVSDGQLGFYMRYDRQYHIYYAISGHTIFLYKTFTS